MSKNSFRLIHQGEMKNHIILNNEVYKPYLVGKLPPKFAFIYDEESEKDGICQWFNFRGLTYIKKD
jgi:hypothetical protein